MKLFHITVYVLDEKDIWEGDYRLYVVQAHTGEEAIANLNQWLRANGASEDELADNDSIDNEIELSNGIAYIGSIHKDG